MDLAIEPNDSLNARIRAKSLNSIEPYQPVKGLSMSRRVIVRNILTAAIVLFAFTMADARNHPTDPRVERAKTFTLQKALDTGEQAAQGTQAVPLGVANPAVVNSRGMLHANTWRDWQANSSVGRMVATNPPASGVPMVQFSYMTKASGISANLVRWGFNAYDAAFGALLFPGGPIVVQSPVDADQESGYYPKIAVGSNGDAIMAGYDRTVSWSGPSQLHTVFDDGPAAGNFGDINSGSVMSEATRTQGSLSPGTETIWPQLAISEFGGQTIIYLAAYESAANLGAMKVFRKVGKDAMNPDDSWVLVFTDTSFNPTQDIACDPTSVKVAVAWTKPVPGDNTDYSDDVWMAESPTGLPGTWTRTNITNYSGAGYRAWLELSCLYDTGGRFHVIWNGSKTDGVTFGSRACRLFHWSQWNPANIYTMYSAEWDPATTQCAGGFNVMNVGNFSFAECDNALFVVFASFNDSELTGHNDDCCKSAPENKAANGEYFVTRSKDLQGKSWDRPTNLSNSYTPDCDTGTCADDRYGSFALMAVDDALFPGTETWPAAATFDPTGNYAGTKYLQMQYVTDRYPGGAPLGYGPYTNNDMRWIRLACYGTLCVCPWPIVDPPVIDFPAYTTPGVQKDTTLVFENTGNVSMTFDNIAFVYDSSKPGGFADWLGITGIGPGSVIPEASSRTATLQLNKGGIVTGQPRQLFGKVVFTVSGGSISSRTLTLPVKLTIAGNVPQPQYDTVSTACTKLTVASNGNMGHDGIGKANMNFKPPIECDTGYNNRGNADIYLYDGSPVIVRKTGASSYVASWSIFSDGFASDNGFKPLAGFAAPQHITTNPKADIYKSGTFCTVDSLVKVEKTWYAPKGFADSCKLIIEKTQFFPYAIGSVTGLAIGEAIDWDVPSDSNNTSNVAGQDWTARKLIWMRGVELADTLSSKGYDCRNNGSRYAGMGVLNIHTKNCTFMNPYGGYAAANDSFVYPSGTFVPSQLWNNMQVGGANVEWRWTDLHGVITYANTATNGYTLPANDTLTVWTALITIPNAATQAAGLDSLKAQYDRALKFSQNYAKAQGWDLCWSCCYCTQPTRGNVNQVGVIDLADLSLLIAYLTATPRPVLPSPAAANVNAVGIIDLSDLALLIAYLTQPPGSVILPPCGS